MLSELNKKCPLYEGKEAAYQGTGGEKSTLGHCGP